LASVDLVAHGTADGVVTRVWRFRARDSLPVLRSLHIDPDRMVWDEHCSYHLAQHRADWRLVPRPDAPSDAPWRARFSSQGTYLLTAVGERRTRLTVLGSFALRLALLGRALDRLAARELRKVYGAEADALRTLCNST